MPTSFDAKAATWDEEPRRRALAMAVVEAITRLVPLRSGLRLEGSKIGANSLDVT